MDRNRDKELLEESHNALDFSRSSFFVEHVQGDFYEGGELRRNMVNELHNEICRWGLTPNRHFACIVSPYLVAGSVEREAPPSIF